MMRHSVVLVAMLCVAGTALAQAPSPSGAPADWQARHRQWEQKWQQERQQERARMQERRLDRLAVLLDMTPAQRQQVQTILAAERTRMQQAMKQAMEAGRAAHADTVTRLAQVLDPAQMKKLKLLMPGRHRRFTMARCPMGMHGMRGMHGPMDMERPKGMRGHRPDQGPPPPPPGQ